MQFTASVSGGLFFLSLGAPAQVCICPFLGLVWFQSARKGLGKFPEQHINKYSSCNWCFYARCPAYNNIHHSCRASY